MTQVVTVQTDFADLNQMTQGLVGRVNETHVILPASEPVDVGEWVQFAVTLSDGTPGFAGFGRCVTFVDNGEERMAHQRFDVVFDSLQFDPRGQEIYTHILNLGEGEAEGSEEANGQGEYVGEDEAFEDVGSDVTAAPYTDPPEQQAQAYEEPEEPGSEFDEDEGATMVASSELQQEHLDAVSVIPGDVSEVVDEDYSYADPYADESGTGEDRAEAAPEPEAYPEDLDGQAFEESASVLTGSNGQAYDAPAEDYGQAYSNADPARVNGSAFAYPGGLPIPNIPPRPELDPALRVTRAPRPSDES